jgi:cell division protein FtsI (penicillin-binding protein 3)
VDKHGTILAIETPYYSCALLLREVGDLTTTAKVIAPILSLDAQNIIEEASRRSIYYLVKRRLSLTEYEQLTAVVKASDLEGVLLEKRYGRSFPQHYHGAQVIGFTNTENRGIEGLELAYETYLLPYPEIGKTISYGAQIATTLDMDLQYLLDDQVVTIDRTHYPDSIVGIVMGAKTGEILAATTFPWYDPNSYQLSEVEQRQNKVVTSMYEPGSVFKVFSLAAELQADQADLEEPFYCDGSYTFTMPNGNETTIQCVSAHGSVEPETMIKYSCNGAVAHWALQTDSEDFRNTLMDFGFGTAWDAGMPGSIAGLVSEVENWSGRSKATISFGQEIAVTPLQIATAATALANDGNVIKPYIIGSIVDQSGGKIMENQPTIARRNVIKPEVINRILTGMELATQEGGTATKAAVSGVRVGAKTGTAQVADPVTGTYDQDNFMASTLALVPIQDPQYIIYIGVLNPKGSTIWGSNIAAPAIGSIIADMVRLGRLKSSDMERVTLGSQDQLPGQDRPD